LTVTTVAIICVILMLVLLVLMRLPSSSTRFGSTFRTTRERRSGKDRRQRSIPVALERRRSPRRQEDLAAQYVDDIAVNGLR
jgi:hypothetical protein